MKNSKPQLYKKKAISFIYGFVDIQSSEELLEWVSVIERIDRSYEVEHYGSRYRYEKSIILVFNQNSMGFNEISKLVSLCLKLNEIKFNSIRTRNRFVKLIDKGLSTQIGSFFDVLASMAYAENYFDYEYEEISLVDYKNSSAQIVSQTLDRMTQALHQPKEIMSSVYLSKETYNTEVTKIIEQRSYSTFGFPAQKKNYIEICLFGAGFD